jgi:hypothetical protein
MEPEAETPTHAALIGREKMLLQMATLANAHVVALEGALTQLLLDLNVEGFSAGRISGDVAEGRGRTEGLVFEDR